MNNLEVSVPSTENQCSDKSNVKECPCTNLVGDDDDRIRTECLAFLDHRWQWLFGIYVCFFVPVILFINPDKFMVWFLLNSTGFIYVAVANCEREDPTLSRDSKTGPRELIKLLLACPLVYLLGPYWTLVDTKSGEMDDIVILEGSISEVLKGSGPVIYFLYTYFCYITPFFIGLHFTYLDYIPWLREIELTYDALKKMDKAHWIFLSVSTIIVLALFSYQIYVIHLMNRLLWFSIGLGGFLLFMGIFIIYETRIMHKKLHIHHFQLALFLITLTPCQNAISALCQGLVAGVYVEGISRWAMSNCFEHSMKLPLSKFDCK